MDTLRFELEGGVPLSFAVLVSARNRLPDAPTHPCFGFDSGLIAPGMLDGLRCVGVGLVRHGARPTDEMGAIGAATSWGTPTGIIAPGTFEVGSTRHFQVFYRDGMAAVCGTGQNTSDAVSVRVAP